MKKIIIYILLISCVLSCQKHEDEIKVKQAYLLCDFLTGEDSGGTWTAQTVPLNSTLTNNDLNGDCPSIDFNNFGCGDYVLRYTVESTTCNGCTSFTDINITLPCCPTINITITGICN